MDNNLVLMLALTIGMLVLTFILGFAFGFEDGSKVVTDMNNGCIIYNNAMYCEAYNNLEIVYEKR